MAINDYKRATGVRDQFHQESKEAAVTEVALDLEGRTGFQTGGNRGR